MQDFVDYFTARYKGMGEINQEQAGNGFNNFHKQAVQQERQGKCCNHRDGERQAGHKERKYYVKTGRPDRIHKAIINKTKPELFNEAKTLFLMKLSG